MLGGQHYQLHGLKNINFLQGFFNLIGMIDQEQRTFYLLISLISLFRVEYRLNFFDNIKAHHLIFAYHLDNLRTKLKQLKNIKHCFNFQQQQKLINYRFINNYPQQNQQLLRLMDNFFAKKGLTLSRKGNPKADNVKNGEQLLRTQQQINRTLPHPISVSNNHSLQKNMAFVSTAIKGPNVPQSNYHSLSAQREEKSFSIGASIRLTNNKQSPQHHPPLPKQNQWKYVPTFASKLKSQGREDTIQQQNSHDLSKLSMVDHESNRSFQGNFSLIDRLSNGVTQSQMGSNNRLKNTIQGPRTEIQSVGKTLKSNSYLYNTPNRSREHSESDRKLNTSSDHPALQNSHEKILNERINRLQKQKDDLLMELRKRDGKYVPQEWFQEKYSLLKEINEKTMIIRELQEKLTNNERQSKGRISNLQFQIKMLQGNKSRLQVQSENNKKLYRQEKNKHQQAKDSINKLIFFEDDLIHAKDYNRLKEELEYVLTENARMFQEHQQYILEVADTRRDLAHKLEDLQQEILHLKKEHLKHREKIERFSQKGDDKMLLIKMQNEINFLRKKQEDSIQMIISKQKELEKVMITIKELHEKESLQSENNQNFLDQMNLWQVKDTVAMYQARVADLNELLAVKSAQIQEQKKQIDFLSSEVRNYKEDKHITTRKEKSNENSLKNELQTIQRTLQTQIQIKNKKISNYEESLERKTKQINEKDKFIKNFLLSRNKLLEGCKAEEITQQLKSYFEGPQLITSEQCVSPP